MNIRHDSFLKRLYRTGLHDAVSLFLPDLASTIDWSDLRWIDKELTVPGPKPRSMFADLVARARDIDGSSLRLLIHPELQMTLDRSMGWRVIQYIMALLLQENDPDARVLSVVFYHCPGGGGIKRESHSMAYRGHPLLEAAYWVVGLGDLDATAYLQGDNPFGWGASAWMKHGTEGRAKLWVSTMDRIMREVADEEYRDLLMDAVATYFKLNRTETAEQRTLLASREYAEVNEMAQTVFEKLASKARREGRREGRQEGRQEGLQMALIAMLRSRFGPVPESLETGIRRMTDADRLESLVRIAASVTSLDDLQLS